MLVKQNGTFLCYKISGLFPLSTNWLAVSSETFPLPFQLLFN